MIQEKHEIQTQAILPMSKINNSLTRNFAYKLSDKKATSNLLKAASREPLEFDEKQRCTVLLFSVGSYMKVAFPTLNEWKMMSDDSHLFGKFSVKVNKIVPGFD